MGGGGKSGGSSGGDTTIRYAPYLEAAHKTALEEFEGVFNATLGTSPYDNYDALVPADSLFGRKPDGVTNWRPGEFPSLWDMFGKFMAGLDVEVLWSQMYERAVRGSDIDNAVSAHAQMMRDQIDTEVMPRFLSGMRDINAVNSSAFQTGRAIIEDGYIKTVNKFATDVRLKAIDISTQLWHHHLEWNKTVITVYKEMIHLHFVAHMDNEKDRIEFKAKHRMWDINLFEHLRGLLGALGGGHPVQDQNKPGTVQRAIGGIASGAASGAMIAQTVGMSTPWGAAIGGAVGLAGAIL